MADRIPLIVDSSSNQVKELPAGDSIILADNEKLKVGTSSDLNIFHDSSHSYIQESGTGDLRIDGDSVWLRESDGTNQISAYQGTTKLYKDGTERLATTSTGVSVAGLLTASTSANISQVALTSASNVSWDARAAANAYLELGHNVTIGIPSNPVEGAIISVEIAQPGSGGPYTVAWNTIYEFAASTAPTITATASKTDILSFRYNGSIWQEIGRVQNMAQT